MLVSVLSLVHFLIGLEQRRAKANSADMQLDNVYGVPSRETALTSLIRRICSSVRNAFRIDVSPDQLTNDSILSHLSYSLLQIYESLFSADMKNRRNLATFTYYMAERYKRGGASEGLDLKYTLRIALMVCSFHLTICLSLE